MKKLAILAVLSLGACTTVPVTNPSTGNPVVTDVMKIQALAIKICAFEPTAETVTNIITSLVPGASPTVTLISQIAHSICDAMVPKVQAFMSAPPAVNGVPIEGRFVKRRR